MNTIYTVFVMAIKILFVTITLFFNCSIFSQTIPVDLYQVLKKFHYRPTSSIIVVSIQKQTLYLFKEGVLQKSYLISTAKNGVGQEEGSEKTPIGLHLIASKYGQKSALFTIFRSKKDTGKIWDKDRQVDEDLVLSRILCLEGLEEGKNLGKNNLGVSVDSFKRYIYIHGTNQEAKLGAPSSKGCIRMANNDILELFEQVSSGSLVWIAS
jgi:lipoprotein-anchoring transpeptidase ErfK/SrfK